MRADVESWRNQHSCNSEETEKAKNKRKKNSANNPDTKPESKQTEKGGFSAEIGLALCRCLANDVRAHGAEYFLFYGGGVGGSNGGGGGGGRPARASPHRRQQRVLARQPNFLR